MGDVLDETIRVMYEVSFWRSIELASVVYTAYARWISMPPSSSCD